MTKYTLLEIETKFRQKLLKIADFIFKRQKFKLKFEIFTKIVEKIKHSVA